jgi:hypothetical protein
MQSESVDLIKELLLQRKKHNNNVHVTHLYLQAVMKVSTWAVFEHTAICAQA